MVTTRALSMDPLALVGTEIINHGFGVGYLCCLKGIHLQLYQVIGGVQNEHISSS